MWWVRHGTSVDLEQWVPGSWHLLHFIPTWGTVNSPLCLSLAESVPSLLEEACIAVPLWGSWKHTVFMSGSHLTTLFLNCWLLLTNLSNICQNDLMLWTRELNILLRDGDGRETFLSHLISYLTLYLVHQSWLCWCGWADLGLKALPWRRQVD